MSNLNIKIVSPFNTDESCGTKITMLVELKKLGIAVPDFCAVPSCSFETFCQNANIPSLDLFYSNSKFNGDVVKKFIHPNILNREEIIRTLGDGKYMVRSSSVPTKNVDSETFPSMISGAFESFFACSSSEAIDCIPKVWKSVFYEKAYNQCRIFSNDSLINGIGVLIQRYIEPVISGVAHIRENKATVNWVKGHLSKIVNGEISGNSIELYESLEGNYILRGIEKNILSIRKNKYENVLKSLLDVSIIIRQHFNHNQEIEWIYDGEKIWVIQSQSLI